MHLSLATAALVLTALLFASPTSAAEKPADLLIGKWQSAQPVPNVVQFTSDGKVALQEKAADGQVTAVGGTYRWTPEGTVEIELTVMGQSRKEAFQVKVSKEELTLTDQQGNRRTFQRSK